MGFSKSQIVKDSLGRTGIILEIFDKVEEIAIIENEYFILRPLAIKNIREGSNYGMDAKNVLSTALALGIEE